MTHHDDRDIERLVEARLGAYRPTAPPPGLRDRIVPAETVSHNWLWAVAATLVLATAGLSWATYAVEQRTATLLGPGDPPEVAPPDPRLAQPGVPQ